MSTAAGVAAAPLLCWCWCLWWCCCLRVSALASFSALVLPTCTQSSVPFGGYKMSGVGRDKGACELGRAQTPSLPASRVVPRCHVPLALSLYAHRRHPTTVARSLRNVLPARYFPCFCRRAAPLHPDQGCVPVPGAKPALAVSLRREPGCSQPLASSLMCCSTAGVRSKEPWVLRGVRATFPHEPQPTSPP